MANILIVYGTTEGHTRKIAHHVNETAWRLGQVAEVLDSSNVTEPFSMEPFRAAIVLGSLHQGQHQNPCFTLFKSTEAS